MLPCHAFSFCVRISFQHTQSCQQSLFVHAPKQSFQTFRSLSFCIQHSFYTICIYSRIAQFAFSLFLRETIFFIICFFTCSFPILYLSTFILFFLLSYEENYCFWYGAFIPSKAISTITNAVMSLTIIQQILSHKNQFLFPSVFLPQCPHSRFFFCKRSFFRAKNLRRSYSSFTKASAFRTKRSFFRTKSRLSFCSSLPFETHRIYSHLLQTKFLSRKK